MPLKQGDTDTSLQYLDASADGRLRHREELRRAPETTMLCSEHRVTQIAQVKGDVRHCCLLSQSAASGGALSPRRASDLNEQQVREMA